MKKLSGIAAGLALAALVSQPLVASAAPAAADEGAWVSSAFGGLGPITSGGRDADRHRVGKRHRTHCPVDVCLCGRHI